MSHKFPTTKPWINIVEKKCI